MSNCRNPRIALILTLTLALMTTTGASAAERLGFGTPVDKPTIAGWDIDVRPDGVGLPTGSGSAIDGEVLYMDKCAACHGEFGEGAGRYPVLMGGYGTLTSQDPNKTVGSYWPYATTLYDYIRRAMPFGDAQTLSADELYAISAYVLYMNDIVAEDAVLDAKSLAAVKMPNRDGFILPDPRPDVHRSACMKDCKTEVKVKSFARKIAVTPDVKINEVN